MGTMDVEELMDDMEQRAEDRLKLLHVLENAQMMQVTREAIVAWIEDQRARDRLAFGVHRQRRAALLDDPRET